MNPAADMAVRKRWFRFFPEGAIEFLIITRVGIVGVLLALLVIKASQRDLVLVVLGGLLWIDHVVVLSWLLPMARDVVRPHGDNGGSRPAETAFMLASLASAAVLAILLPWQELLRLVPGLGAHRRFIGWIGAGLAAVVFAAAAAMCGSRLRLLGLEGGLWRVLIHLPGLHWPAVHRFAALVSRRMSGPGTAPGGDSADNPALTASHVLWFLCMLAWAGHILLTATRGWPERFPGLAVPLAGALAGALFAVVQLAALERVQRTYLTWLGGR